MCGGASCVLPALAAVPGVPVASRCSRDRAVEQCGCQRGDGGRMPAGLQRSGAVLSLCFHAEPRGRFWACVLRDQGQLYIGIWLVSLPGCWWSCWRAAPDTPVALFAGQSKAGVPRV